MKKQLSEGESLDSKKSSAELENELFELRVDLNYITVSYYVPFRYFLPFLLFFEKDIELTILY